RSSLCVRPGSRKWTWSSITPGRRCKPWAEIISSAEVCTAGSMAAMRSPSTSRSVRCDPPGKTTVAWRKRILCGILNSQSAAVHAAARLLLRLGAEYGLNIEDDLPGRYACLLRDRFRDRLKFFTLFESAEQSGDVGRNALNGLARQGWGRCARRHGGHR